MKALLLISVVVLNFEFQLTSAGRGGNGRGGGGGRGDESRASSGGRSNGRRAMWERIEALGNKVDMLGGKLEYFAELIRGLIKKDGKCPKPQSDVFGICVEECGYDWDCPDDLKCCSNGCGHVCMKPAEEDICNQPKVAGPCEAFFPRWYYNASSGLCESFIYGGCGGNGNNFETQKECEKECAEEDICNQPKVAGPCKAYFPRWYYNASSGLCESFIYGGCGGNGNNFETQKECEKECAAPVSHCPPGTTESNPSVYCGRGGTPCDKGYDCVIAPNDAYAVCCLNPGCPDGMPLASCLRDPCEDAVCNAYPTADCTANYCGGCNTDWTVNGDPVQCDLKGK